MHLLMQFSLAKHADLPDVPLIMDLARTDEQRQMFRLIFARQVMGRPFQGPPGIPADRLRALQQAFMDTMKDKEFLAEAEKAQFEITPVAGEAIEKLVAEAHRTPLAVAEKAGLLIK
jgi:tripartite-type tricarboxylate transporter receptor subunit TctC